MELSFPEGKKMAQATAFNYFLYVVLKWNMSNRFMIKATHYIGGANGYIQILNNL